MPVSQSADSSTEFPRFYVSKEGGYYVVSQLVLAIPEDSVPVSVREELNKNFRPAEICEIPEPRDDGVGWIALQTKVQVGPGPGGGG